GEVDVLIRRYQVAPRRHEVVPDLADAGEVHHAFWKVESDKKVAVTADVLASHAPAIVFCRTRHGADRLTKRLAERGITAAPIHGARSQPQRDRALAAFQAGAVQALIATDVAARGIHVDQVACVVHYDLPADHKDYLHRSGRTGRAGLDGIVVTMVGRDQTKALRAMQKSLGYVASLDEADLSSLPASAPRPARHVGAPAFRPSPTDRPKRPGPARRYDSGGGSRGAARSYRQSGQRASGRGVRRG
ncbi:MAG: helicase-related protein, partial [Acidimicrobiales bacterium]